MKQYINFLSKRIKFIDFSKCGFEIYNFPYFAKDINLELDDTKEMEEYLAKLNKKKPRNNVVAYVYNWSQSSQIN